MNRIAFELMPAEPNGFDDPGEQVRILIDGVDLIDMLREIEQPYGEAEGFPESIAAYQGLPPELVFLPSRHLLDEPHRGYAEDDKVDILRCECGEPGCWPFMAVIDISDTTVRWSHFEQPHRRRYRGRFPPWSYEALSTFVFDRAQYEQALRGD